MLHKGSLRKYESGYRTGRACARDGSKCASFVRHDLDDHNPMYDWQCGFNDGFAQGTLDRKSHEAWRE